MFRKFPFGRRPLNLVLAGAIATALVSNAAAVPAQAQGPTVVDTMGVVSEIVDLDRDALETLEGLIGSPKAHTASADAALSEMAATETAVVLLHRRRLVGCGAWLGFGRRPNPRCGGGTNRGRSRRTRD